ncbi:MAG: flagellar biosynthesis protein FlhF [Lachnospiraceae bacterium]|nr:flagellar biosynthesis protein FlhF [Lachnospiraceae bacterium]
MIIKKYIAKTEAEAVDVARKELGTGVVIMNVRQIKKKGFFGWLSLPQVEVTVALEEEQKETGEPRVRVQKAPTMTALEQLAAKQKEKEATESKKEIKENRDIIMESLNDEKNPNALEEKLDSIETLIKKRLESADIKEEKKEEEEPHEEENEQMKLTRLLYNMMIDNEVREKYANQIIEEAEKANKPNMPVDYFLTNIYQKMILRFGQPAVITPAEMGPRVVFFVGPTGVGKTTTIAKIASKFCLEEKKKVALLTADTYRIAAAEQLRTYANILEIPCKIIFTPAEIEDAYREYSDYDYILVDTAGHSHHNEEQKNNTNIMIHALENVDVEVYLVLSATTKYKDLTSIADTYKEMTDFKIIFTKLDETTSLGNLLNLKLYTGSELSYVTYGQNVPEDIDRFDPQTTVKKILGGGNI